MIMCTYKRICITNRALVSGDFLEKIRELVAGQVDLLILREKDLDEKSYCELAASVMEICAGKPVKLMLHTFTSVARQLNHPYIHLPMQAFQELSEDDRAWFEEIGVSTHSVEEAVEAEKLGAGYVTASHIFPTKCKEGLEPRGLEYLREVKQAVNIPVYALGGIHPDNQELCLEAGADGICMMSEYMKSEDFSIYERQMLLEGVGIEGQKKLRDAKVLIIGAGGLGSPVALYLAGAGIGTIGLLDADEVSLTNLHRQVIHAASNVGKNKAESAKEQIEKLNERVKVETYPFFFTPENAHELVSKYDFIVDAVDNVESKFLINDACVLAGKPFCHAGVIKTQGQVMTYVPGEGPCYRCVFEEIPEKGSVPTCATVGVLGPVVGIIGCIQATEVLKYFLGIGELLTGKMLIMEARTMRFRVAKFSEKAPNCRVCGEHINIHDVYDNRNEYRRS